MSLIYSTDDSLKSDWMRVHDNCIIIVLLNYNELHWISDGQYLKLKWIKMLVS